VFILVRFYAARGAEEEELEVVTMTYNEEILDSWILLRCKDFIVFFPKVLLENAFAIFLKVNLESVFSNYGTQSILMANLTKYFKEISLFGYLTDGSGFLKKISIDAEQWSKVNSCVADPLAETDPALTILTFLVTMLNTKFTSGSGYSNPIKCGPMRIRIRNQYCGSVTFWYGPGSADPYN
jgi:hypothetical protein